MIVGSPRTQDWIARVQVPGARLAYVEAGRGEPVLLVHGSASDYRTWHRQRETFAACFRVIAYSRRFHWPNRPITAGADYSMAEHVADLRAALHALDAAPAHLVGHSYGAFVCLLLALQAPQLVRSLVLTEPPVVTLFVSNEPTPWELLRLALTRPRTAVGIIALGATGLRPARAAAERGEMGEVMRFFGTAVLGREALGRLSEERRRQVRANLIPAEFLGSGLPPLRRADLHCVRQPTLLLTGDRSPRVFHRLADALAELLPQAERVKIAGASHIVHEDAAAAYDAAVLAFLAAHPRSTDAPHPR